jgi:hypothetical protein
MVPPQPQVKDFLDENGILMKVAYQLALGAWERVCKSISEN